MRQRRCPHRRRVLAVVGGCPPPFPRFCHRLSRRPRSPPRPPQSRRRPWCPDVEAQFVPMIVQAAVVVSVANNAHRDLERLTMTSTVEDDALGSTCALRRRVRELQAALVEDDGAVAGTSRRPRRRPSRSGGARRRQTTSIAAASAWRLVQRRRSVRVRRARASRDDSEPTTGAISSPTSPTGLTCPRSQTKNSLLSPSSTKSETVRGSLPNVLSSPTPAIEGGQPPASITASISLKVSWCQLPIR